MSIKIKSRHVTVPRALFASLALLILFSAQAAFAESGPKNAQEWGIVIDKADRAA